MNEEPPTPFDTIGDEPVEARIVAWVLGEASAFEAAELERLCEERPELLVFRRRMRALHGLLTEAEAAEPDNSWKLPPEKRRLLDEIFGEEKVIRLDPQKEKGIRRSGRRALLGIAACVAVTLFVLRLTPWKHEAEAIIEVKSRAVGMEPFGSASAESAKSSSPQFFGTEFEKIKSRNSLEKVVENLELAERWNLDKESAIKRVKDSIETKNVRGTDLISIRVREANEQDAREITREVVASYKAYRSDIEKREADKGLLELKKAIRDQEDKVEERRKVLATIVRTKGIVYKGQDSFYGQSGVDEDQGARNALETYNQLQRDKMQMESQINSLQKYDSDQLMSYAAGLDLPDNVIRNLHPQYLEAKRHLDGLKISGAGEGHPTVKEAADQVDTMKQQLDEGVVTLRETLKAKLDAANDNLKNVEVMKDDTREDAIKRGLDAQDYVDAKREFEADQQLLQSMKLKQINEEITRKMTEESVVVHELPPPLESDNSSPPSWKSDVAYKPEPAAIDLTGGSEFKLRAPQTELAMRPAKAQAVPPASPASPSQPEPGIAPASASVPRNASGGFSNEGDQVAAGDGYDFARKSEMFQSQTTAAARSDSSSLLEKRDANNVDSIPNHPNRPEAEGLAKAGEIKFESAATPPVLEAREAAAGHSHFDGFSDSSVIDGELGSLADRPSELPEAQKRFAQSATGVNSSAGTVRAGVELIADYAYQLSPAEPVEHGDTVDQLRRNLYIAEGSYNLGKFDDARKSYQDALKIDPHNEAARQGLEQVEVAKSDFYRAANDHTRTELLSQVDSTWELTVPADAAPLKDKETKAADLAERQQRLVKLRRQLDDHGDFKKQAIFKEWQNLKKEIDEMTDGELPAEIDEPQTKLTELMEEIPASENPYSTFSLNISDASFQLAKAALEKGERPDPASIKTEQFYNAVDYGDPAPTANESVAATIEQSAHPVIPGRNLVRVALRTGSVGRSAAQPLRLTLLVDQSGSMVREDRRASMENALAQLSGLLTKDDLVTVIGFSRTPHLLADGMTGDKAAKLGDLVNQTANEGGTNLEEAMKLAGQLAERHQLAAAQNRIVLFTDGAANLGDANPERLAAQVKSFRQKGLAFDIAGIGADGLNDRLLSELARNGNGRYYVVGEEKNDSFARQLAGAFRPAAENVKVQVNFNPQRVGKYKLIGFEKDRLKTEDFRNDAVDAAELAAEEAGVAIYQVEPLAKGTGEIGEVSVRFRDAASKEMVERTWTIPYDAQATAFDRATPSMQLAGLSLLAAEKLKGGPMADAIDFKQLTGPSAVVKQFYGASARVGEMLQVIEKLK